MGGVFGRMSKHSGSEISVLKWVETMERVGRKFSSFEEMNRSDIEQRVSMTPEERSRHFVELINRYKDSFPHADEASPRDSRHVVKKKLHDA